MSPIPLFYWAFRRRWRYRKGREKRVTRHFQTFLLFRRPRAAACQGKSALGCVNTLPRCRPTAWDGRRAAASVVCSLFRPSLSPPFPLSFRRGHSAHLSRCAVSPFVPKRATHPLPRQLCCSGRGGGGGVLRDCLVRDSPMRSKGLAPSP